MFFAACGDGSDDGNAPAPKTKSTTATTAAELVADIPSLGFKPVTDQAAGFAETEVSKVAIFESSSGKVSSLRLEVNLLANSAAAMNNFDVLAEALKNPPPGLFGANTKQTAGTPAYQADQSRSYKTDKPDNKGTFVFSDIHRFGRAVVIIYTIGPDDPETVAMREKVAQQLAAKAPR